FTYLSLYLFQMNEKNVKIKIKKDTNEKKITVMKYRLSSEPLIFFYTVIYTINYTVLPQLVVRKTCHAHAYNETLCSNEDFLSKNENIKKESTTWWFFLLLGSLLPSVFTVLIWGPITDVIGRRHAMTIVPFINGIRSLIYLINSYYIDAHVGYLLFGSFLSCFYGEFQGVVALCYAYLADVTTDHLDQRTMRMALIEASLFFAGIPAGLLSGYLLESLGFVSVFGLNIGINVCILLYVIFYLPKDSSFKYEKLPDKNNHSKSEHSAVAGLSSSREEENIDNLTTGSSSYDKIQKTSREDITCNQLFNPFSHFAHVFKVVTSPSCRKIVIPVIFSFGFSVCAIYGELVVQTLYLTNQPFAFSPQTIGYYSAVQSAIRGCGVIIMTQLSYHIFDLSDFSLIVIGIISQMACYISIGLSRTILPVFLVNIAGLGIPVGTTTLRSLATKNVSSENYGAVLASLEAMDVLAGVLTNASTLWTYNVTLHVYSGIAYFALGGFSFLSLVFLVIAYCLRRDIHDNSL
uniref:Proton-coupled folate transporter n=2 Tax=Clytia hemisphaerica TaxID=252671 RepID=A0A7M5X3V9_9CNID